LARGKVRDNYAVGEDRILMVASDRISAFDVIMGEPIPGKGVLLTQMALFWFDQLGPKGLNICPIHLTGDAPESVVSADEEPLVTGRSMLVKRLKPIPVEAVVRGYLAGSGWKEYQDNQAVCGVKLPPDLKNASRLPEPIYTPAAKAAVGEHDENITFEQTVAMINQYGGQMKETYGVPVEEIQEAIKHGVRKINIDTDIRLAMTAAVRKFLFENPDKFDAREWLKPAREAAKQICKQRYLQFGCEGQAPKIKGDNLQVVAARYARGELAQVVN
jgi:phosphoribosylaminoimidazole-succinocarboxamide synthase